MLRFLIQRPGILVTKDELLDAVWPDAIVSEGTLNKSIGELRNAFGDDSGRPGTIETVPRRGFRWVGGTNLLVQSTPRPAAASAQGGEAAPSFVGRETEVEALERCFSMAASGTRQVVFVTGEAGTGKSTLVEAFAARVQSRNQARVAHGQCIEAYGQNEPYRPLLEAVERLCTGEHGGPVLDALRSRAPTWLKQIPSLTVAAAPTDDDVGMAPVRMLREIATALEEIAGERPLVIVLEDAHWADLATVDSCNLLARRRDGARLMLIVTMRPADAFVSQNPVLASKTDLVSGGHASEVALTLFTPAVIERYLTARYEGLQLDPQFPAWIHHQTGGNALFVRILVDDLVQRGVLSKKDDGRWHVEGSLSELREFVPDSLRQLVERHVERFSADERAVLEAASVLRGEFAASAVAAVGGNAAEDIEEICERLARRGQILKRVARGGAANSGCFAFVHSIVQRSLHDRLAPSKLRRLHLAAAEHLERTSSGRPEAIALELALHYAMAREPFRALTQLQRAAASIQQIPAPREVIVIREQILDLVEQSPELPGHHRELIVAVMELAEARQLAFAVVDAETTALCERVVELATSPEDGAEWFKAKMGLFSSRFYTGRYEEGCEIGRHLLGVAEMVQHPFMIKSAHFAIAGAGYRLARFDEARTHFEACLQHTAGSQQTYGWDFHLMSMTHLALVAIHQKRPDEARRLIHDGEAYATQNGTTPDAAAIPLFGYALAILGDDDHARTHIDRALPKSERIGAAAWIERARFVDGLLLSRQGQTEEGMRRMKDSLARQARNNVYLDRSAYCALLAEEMLRRGASGARSVVDEGVTYMERSNERHFEGELRRLRASLS